MQARSPHPPQSMSQAPKRSCFLGKAGCEQDDSGQQLLLPTQTHGPVTFPPCGDVSWGRLSTSGRESLGGSHGELPQPHHPGF